jgi:hypothetical protein
MQPTGLYRDNRWSDPRRAIGPGIEFEERSVFGRLHGRVSEFDPPTRVAFHLTLRWRGWRIFQSRPAHTLASTRSGTSIIHVAEGAFVGPLRLLDSLFWPLARRERVQTIDALEASFQGDGPTAASD